MNVRLISYATKPFYKSQYLLKRSAYKYGITDVVSFTDKWLKQQHPFYEKNINILTQKRGAGFWLWKPYIIFEALKDLAEDDVLIYIDSGTAIIDSLKTLIRITQEKGIVLFYNDGHKNNSYTKRDCFFLMDCDQPEFHNGWQVVGGYIFIKNTLFNRNLIKEWLEYASDERIITDNPNRCGFENFSNFKDHRHDQSILSLLAHKYQFELFRDPSQWGNKYKMHNLRETGEFFHDGYAEKSMVNSPYPTVLNSHRTALRMTMAETVSYYFKLFFGK